MPSRPFLPPVRTLLGPGPSDVHPRVLAAMARPTVGHLDPAFVSMMEDLKGLLRAAFRTTNELTFPVSGPGSAGMETCFVNLLEPGDVALVCRNGVFGDRMRENVERAGGVAVVVDDPWGEPVGPDKVEAALEANPGARVVGVVQAETSTGALTDVRAIAEVAHHHGALAIVDSVTALGGVELEVDAWGLDAVYAGSQKCLSCPPGLAPVTFGARAVERIRARTQKVRSWFLDLGLVMGYWGSGAKRVYHHTAPVNLLYALHEALLLLHEEGIENAWARHARNHRLLRAGLEAMGLTLPVRSEARLPPLNLVAVPPGVDEALVRRRLLEEHGVEIGAGLGTLAGTTWRIGLMGHASRWRNVVHVLFALDHVLGSMHVPIRHGAAVPAALAALDAEGPLPPASEAGPGSTAEGRA